MKLGSYVITFHQTKGPKSPQVFTFKNVPLMIGRRDCNLILDDDHVSSKHATIEVKENKFFIKDVGSLEGIKVNDQSGPEFELKTGDRISIGPYEFKIEWKELAFTQNILEEKLKTRCTPGTPESVIEEVFLEELEQT